MTALEFIVRLFKPLLYPFAILYGAILWIRNKFYDKGIYSSIEFDIPVISVGNLSVGGTGKTPHVSYLINLLKYPYQVATMSRGYKRHSKGFKIATPQTNAFEIGDEPMQFYAKNPDITVSVCEDRLTGIPQLLRNRPQLEVILLDDAFQHRSVKSGINILITDFNKPFYKDYILPFGRLREQRSAYKRADLIIVSKCPENINDSQKSSIIQAIRPKAHQEVFFSTIRYKHCEALLDSQLLQLNKNLEVILVSGIANPSPMIQYLENACQSVHLLKYPDHYYFSRKDIEEMKAAYENASSNQKVIITTEKDATRLLLHKELIREYALPIYTLPMNIEFLEKKEQFHKKIIDYIEADRIEKNTISQEKFIYEEIF